MSVVAASDSEAAEQSSRPWLSVLGAAGVDRVVGTDVDGAGVDFTVVGVAAVDLAGVVFTVVAAVVLAVVLAVVALVVAAVAPVEAAVDNDFPPAAGSDDPVVAVPEVPAVVCVELTVVVVADVVVGLVDELADVVGSDELVELASTPVRLGVADTSDGMTAAGPAWEPPARPATRKTTATKATTAKMMTSTRRSQ